MKLYNQNFFREQYINEIINNIDWNKIQSVMQFLGWNWALIGIPTVDQLKERGTKYLRECYETCLKSKLETYIIASGGLKASSGYNKELNKIDYLELEFILEHWYLDEDYIKSIDKK